MGLRWNDKSKLPPIASPVPFPQMFKCIKGGAVCKREAEVIFEGSTYCLPCLHEQLRTGGL